MEEPHEKKNRNVGMIVSIGAHALLLLLFVFLLAWRAPDPPLPEYGIEINFGVSEVGSGDVQPETPPVESQSEEEPAPEEAAAEEVPAEEMPVEEIIPEEPVTEPVTEPAEVTPEPVKTQQESPEVVKEKPEPEKKPAEQPKEQPKKEPVKQPVQEQPETETQTGAKGEGQSQDPPAASQGDDTDKTGDKGDEQGELDARALYGKPGGGQGGASLSIVGWTWDEEPRKKDSSNENGTVTFEFMIDEDGYVIFTKTLKSSVSPSVARFYEDQLKQVTFSRTGTGAVKPGNTKGTVTFTIVSK